MRIFYKQVTFFEVIFPIQVINQNIINQGKIIKLSGWVKYPFTQTQQIDMNDSQHPLNQKVKIMDNSVTFDLTLTFNDIMKDMDCSKEEIARRFKLLVQQKQSLIRKQIIDVNSRNLKILQQKSVYFQEVNKTNRELAQELQKRKGQILKLSKKIEDLSEQLREQRQLMQQKQQQFRQFQEHTLQDYKRLQAVELKYKQLLSQIEAQTNRKNQLQRKIYTMQNETINWNDRIKYLMQNREMGMKQEYDEEINKLKDILYFYEHNNSLLKKEIVKGKQEIKEMKESFQITIAGVQRKYGIEKVNNLVHSKVQTEEHTIKKIDVGVEIHVECQQCKKINDVARHCEKKSVHVQTMKDPRTFRSDYTQTTLPFPTSEQQLDQMIKIKHAFDLSEKHKQLLQAKIIQLQGIMQHQPSKTQDLKAISRLQSKNEQKDRSIELLKHEIMTLKSLNTVLHNELQMLKMQLRQVSDVRIESLEFLKKNTASSYRMFTEELTQIDPKRMAQTEVSPQKSIINEKKFVSEQKFTNDERFSKTVDLNLTSTRINTSGKNRFNVSTPDIKPKTCKSGTRSAFQKDFSKDLSKESADTYRWERFEKKLKNPELFSQSPYVNAVRRQKYKKFSLLKKKNNQHEGNINFTVAF